MGNVIGDILPVALGVAVSPVPIIAVILMLLSPHAKSTSVGFMLGWLLGILLAVVAFTLLSAQLPEQGADESKPIIGVVQLVLGGILLFLALRQWKGRPKPGEDAKLPGWMQAIDSMNIWRALLLGLMLSAVNPKNLMMGVSAGLSIGGAGLQLVQTVLATMVFVVVAAVTVAAPVIIFLIAGERMRDALDTMREWLAHNNATIMAVLMLVIGVVVLSKGIQQF